MLRTRFCSLAIAAAIPLLAGCDAGADDRDPDGSPAADREASVELAPVDRSGVTGTVRADHEDDEARVILSLQGLRPGAAYQANLHSGRCTAGGPVAAPLGEVTGDEDGAGRLTETVRASRLGPEEPAFVQIEDSAGEAVACADLPGHGPAGPGMTDRPESAGAERADSPGERRP